MKNLRFVIVLFIIASLAVTFTVGAKSILSKSTVNTRQIKQQDIIKFDTKVRFTVATPTQLPLNADLYFAFGAIVVIGGYLLVKNNFLTLTFPK
jgi:hypothetical protein